MEKQNTNAAALRQRIATHPSYERTRENIAEFERAGKGAKLVSDSLRLVAASSCDKNMISRLTRQAHFGFMIPVSRWLVDDVTTQVQLFKTLCVSGFGANTTHLHELITIQEKCLCKTATVPAMEQGHVKANLRGAERMILLQMPKECIQMLNVVHGG